MDISNFLGVSNMDIEIYGNLDIWMNKQMYISTIKYIDIWIYYYIDIHLPLGCPKKQGFQVSQGSQICDIWIYWYIDTWIYEYLDIWIYEYIDIRIYGGM